MPHACADGWVCEEHPEQPWLQNDCAGPGMPCHVCNPNGDRRPEFKPIYASTRRAPDGLRPYNDHLGIEPIGNMFTLSTVGTRSGARSRRIVSVGNSALRLETS
jgi:hypothetical protein